jgi:hypothetical protein
MKSTVALVVAGAFALSFCLDARGESVRVSDRQPRAVAVATEAGNPLDADLGDTCGCGPASIGDANVARSGDAPDADGEFLLGLAVDPSAADGKLLTRHVAASLVSPAATSIGALPLAGAVELARLSLVNIGTSKTDMNRVAKHRAAAPAARTGYAESLR